MSVDTKKYVEFVDAVTSQPSKDHEAFIYRLQEIEGQGFHSERLLTAAVGMCAEAGEFTEVVKKIIFQGKPVNEENMFHLKRIPVTSCGMLLKHVWVLALLLTKSWR